MLKKISIKGRFIQLEKPKYWIYVVIHEFYENLASLQPFSILIENFALSLGSRAEVILPYKNTYAINRQAVLSCDWNEQTRQSLIKKKNPYFLVLPCEMTDFKPNTEIFVIIEFPNPTTDPNRHFDILFELAQEINTKSNIWEWKYVETVEVVTDGLVIRAIDTDSGAIVYGDVNTSGGDFIGRDKIVTEINIYLH